MVMQFVDHHQKKKKGKNHLIGKWLPREKGSEKKIFELLVQRLFTYDYDRNRNRAKTLLYFSFCFEAFIRFYAALDVV